MMDEADHTVERVRLTACTGALITLLHKPIQLPVGYWLLIAARLVCPIERSIGEISFKNSYPCLPPVLHHLVMFTDSSSPSIKFFGPSILTNTI